MMGKGKNVIALKTSEFWKTEERKSIYKSFFFQDSPEKRILSAVLDEKILKIKQELVTVDSSRVSETTIDIDVAHPSNDIISERECQSRDFEEMKTRWNNQTQGGNTVSHEINQAGNEVQLSVGDDLAKNNQTAQYSSSEKRVEIKPHNVETSNKPAVGRRALKTIISKQQVGHLNR